MNIQQAKNIAIVDLLGRLGHQPVHIRKSGKDWWYCSPFRAENTPSFHVNLSKNIWYDFGGQGGDILDFVTHYRACSVSEALAYLGHLFRVDLSAKVKKTNLNSLDPPKPGVATSTLVLRQVQSLQHPKLIQYLQERKIALPIARQYLKEANFYHSIRQKNY